MHLAQIMKNILRREDDRMTFELSQCLYLEIYTDAFIRSLYVHKEVQKCNS